METILNDIGRGVVVGFLAVSFISFALIVLRGYFLKK